MVILALLHILTQRSGPHRKAKWPPIPPPAPLPTGEKAATSLLTAWWVATIETAAG